MTRAMLLLPVLCVPALARDNGQYSRYFLEGEAQIRCHAPAEAYDSNRVTKADRRCFGIVIDLSKEGFNMNAPDLKHIGTLLLPLLLLGSQSASAASTATGPTALALAAVIAPHSPLLNQQEKHVIAGLFDGQSNVTSNTKISVKADVVDCRESDVDLTSRSCKLSFGSASVNLSGRNAHEIYATIFEAGVPPDGGAGTIHESLSQLACIINPAEIVQKSGGGADCTFEPNP